MLNAAKPVLALFLCLVAANAGAADPKNTAPPFPTASDADFAALLDWMSTAGAAERDAFLGRASAADGLDAEARSALTVLRQLAAERGVKTLEAVRGWTSLSATPATTPTWAATAAFRSAQLLEQEGQTQESVRMLAAARRLNRHGSLWRRTEGGWRKEPVDDATGTALRRLQADRVTYRAMAWVADAIPLAGAYRFLGFLVVLVLAIRGLELPLFLRALDENEKQARGRAATQRYIVFWLIVDVISINWAQRGTALWQFLFDLDGTSFLWMSSLAVRDAWLAAILAVLVCGYCCALNWTGWIRLSLQAKRGWVAYFATIALVVGSSHYFGDEAAASGALYTIVLCLSGMAIVAVHRITIWCRGGAWLKA